MELSAQALYALCPLDGRYYEKVRVLREYFSEWAYFQYRLLVEVEYLIALSTYKVLPALSQEEVASLRTIYQNFDVAGAQKIKEYEKSTNHDVKAIEYYLRQVLAQKLLNTQKLSVYQAFVHFGLTSQDINNTAIPLMLRQALHDCYIPALEKLLSKLTEVAIAWRKVPMLAFTHGQPASPTTLGKEFLVFVERLQNQLHLLQHLEYPAKFGGATGNFNAHLFAFPNVDWLSFANYFVEQILGLRRNQVTTQIDHYDGLAAIFDNLRRINIILLDFCQDCWLYISKNYFKLKIVESEVGSSTMPHKVNPIDFENAEGNLGIANALLEHMSRKLPVSRLQRDLSDSTVLRNIGLPVGYSYLAILSIVAGLSKLEVNLPILQQELEQQWVVLAEAIQTVLRKYGDNQAYEKLKALTRGVDSVSKELFSKFIEELAVPKEEKDRLLALTPDTYLGYAPELEH
ncbi:MAG: adenylosuccinate lyase [Bacteroidia bacterium]|nr:adenylosuccinate lyase [Bacteroidia bacterium]MDW8157819.1 adenylosuccinate lyase [Bacteroidia bacterium]